MNRKLLWIHTFIAIILVQFLMDEGSVVKYMLLPYVIFMIFSRRQEIFPALAIMMSAGTTMTYFVSIASFIFFFLEYRDIKKLKLSRLFWTLFFLLILQLFMTVYRMATLGYSFVNALKIVDYFIAFPFFIFGALMGKKVQDEVLLKFILILLAIGVIRVAMFPDFLLSLERIGIYSTVFMWVFFYYFVRRGNYSLILSSWVTPFFFLFGLNLLFVLSSYKFTAMLSILLSLWLFHSVYLNQKNISITLSQRVSRLVVYSGIGSVLFLFIGILFAPIYSLQYSNVNVNYDLSTNIFEQIMSKLFADRGVIWWSVFNRVIQNGTIGLPIIPFEVEYVSARGASFEVDFQTHNLLLELVRMNGIAVGLIMSYIYFVLIRFTLTSATRGNWIDKVIASVVFGLGVVIYTVGQATLLPTVSFVYMTLGGMVHGRNYKR